MAFPIPQTEKLMLLASADPADMIMSPAPDVERPPLAKVIWPAAGWVLPAYTGDPADLERARAYLIRTAHPGATMSRQGPEKGLACLHPTFAVRLAAAIREARGSGMPDAGVFSACRPPAFGVGGFGDKFLSAHAYGLAVDMAGIGRPGSQTSLLWQHIAARHLLHNPYFGRKAWEWNHYQPIPTTMVTRALPAIRRTINASGPIDEGRMWRLASVLIDRAPAPRVAIDARPRGRHHHHRRARA